MITDASAGGCVGRVVAGGCVDDAGVGGGVEGDGLTADDDLVGVGVGGRCARLSASSLSRSRCANTLSRKSSADEPSSSPSRCRRLAQAPSILVAGLKPRTYLKHAAHEAIAKAIMSMAQLRTTSSKKNLAAQSVPCSTSSTASSSGCASSRSSAASMTWTSSSAASSVSRMGTTFPGGGV